MMQIIAYIVGGIAIAVVVGSVILYAGCCLGIDIFKIER